MYLVIKEIQFRLEMQVIKIAKVTQAEYVTKVKYNIWLNWVPWKCLSRSGGVSVN